MSAMASQITVVSIVYSPVCSGADQRKHPTHYFFIFGCKNHEIGFVNI